LGSLTDVLGTDGLDSSPTGYAVLKSLLRRHPDLSCLEHANQIGMTPIHLATYNANLTAIKIINDHLAQNSLAIDWNMPMPTTGKTALDCTGMVRGQMTNVGPAYRHIVDSLEMRMAKTYEYLRNRGACLSSEKNAICVGYCSCRSDKIIPYANPPQHHGSHTR